MKIAYIVIVFLFSISFKIHGQIEATNTSDSGPDSLRQAIIDANASSDQPSINFNILGPGPWTINLASSLPDLDNINDVGMIINGHTQPGWTFGDENSMITIDGCTVSSEAYENFVLETPNSFDNPKPDEWLCPNSLEYLQRKFGESGNSKYEWKCCGLAANC